MARALFGNAGLYPLPNNAGTGALGITSNYVSSSASLLKNYQGDVKIDYRPNDKVGQLGTHLVVPHEANNPIAGTGLVASWTPANDRRPLFLNGSLPNVGNIALTESSARMSYNSLQVTGRRRFADGLEFVTTSPSARA